MNFRTGSLALLAIFVLAAGSFSALAQNEPDSPPNPEAPHPSAAAPASASEAPSENSEPKKSYDFVGANTAEVFRQLAREANKTLIMTDRAVEESGTVTVRILEMTPTEVIHIIVGSKGLVCDDKNGIMTVETALERTKEPFEHEAPRWAKMMADFKGYYYASLIKAGVPDETARQLVLNENFSHAGPKPQTEQRESTFERDPRPLPESAPAKNASGSDLGLFQPLAGLTLVGGLLSWLPGLLLHLFFGFAVLFRARRFERDGGSLVFLGPWTWFLTTLLGGFLVAFGYWVIHHSRLKAVRPNS